MNVLIVGAGGIGSSLINTIDFSVVGKLGIVDMDLVEASNLNRQFLFRLSHIGMPKVEAVRIWTTANLTHLHLTCEFYHDKIQSIPDDVLARYSYFFNAVDNLEARLYLNNRLYELRRAGRIPEFVLIDCGSEKLMGHVQVIFERHSPCLACVASLFEQSNELNVNYCSIKRTPLNFDDCLKAAILQSADLVQQSKLDSPRDNGFQIEIIDRENLGRTAIIHKLATKKAEAFGIDAKQFSYTENFLRRFSLNLASTNSIIAALAWSAATNISKNNEIEKNYITVNCENGISVQAYSLEKNPDCRICLAESKSLELEVNSQMTLSYLQRWICEQHLGDFTLFTEEGQLILSSKAYTKSQTNGINNLTDILKPDSNGQMSRRLECYFKGQPEPITLVLTFRE